MLTKAHRQFKALGGDITFVIVSELSDSAAEILLNELQREVLIFERRFSRFLPASELTKFNNAAGVKTYISPEFCDLLMHSIKFSRTTNRLYNPFILPALHRAGYVQSAAEGYENDTQENYSSRQVADIEALEIGDSWAQIPYGTAIDFGGIGKGYLADQLCRLLEKEPVAGFWISLSGDIVTKGTDLSGNNFTVEIQDGRNPERRSDWYITCPETPFGIATSGTIRKLKSMGAGHHIINPKTLQPAETDILLATVCSKSATEADIVASCLVILGSKRSIQFIKSTNVRSALIQYRDTDGSVKFLVTGKDIKLKTKLTSRKELQHAA